ALLSELPSACGVGIDISPGAVVVAQANARSLGLAGRSRFEVGDWGRGQGATYDIVLCNPPYVPAGDIAALQHEVRQFDPWLPLAGGADGLDAYRALAADLPGLLGPDGRGFIEIGRGQSDVVAGFFGATGLGLQGVHRDLAGIPRCLVLGQ